MSFRKVSKMNIGMSFPTTPKMNESSLENDEESPHTMRSLAPRQGMVTPPPKKSGKGRTSPSTPATQDGSLGDYSNDDEEFSSDDNVQRRLRFETTNDEKKTRSARGVARGNVVMEDETHEPFRGITWYHKCLIAGGCCLLVALCLVIVAVLLDFASKDQDIVLGHASPDGGGIDISTEVPQTDVTTNAPSIMVPSAPPVVVVGQIPATEAPTSSPTTSNPTMEPTINPILNLTSPLVAFLEEVSNFEIEFEKDKPSTPNNLAIQWLLEEHKKQIFQNGETPTLVHGPKLTQRFALVSLDLALTGRLLITDPYEPVTDVTSNWPTTWSIPMTDECSWWGIVCNGTVVTELHLAGLGLKGSLPDVLSMLADLTYINFSENAIVGSIPEKLYDLTRLQSLYLYKNQLTGTLSESVGKLEYIENLWLNENRMTGPFPSTLRSSGGVRHPIRYLNLYKNQFTGKIPTNLRLRNLFYMDLGYNRFTGRLPEEIGDKFNSLRHLYLNHNEFTGSIPELYGEIGSGRLESLALDHNQLTGAVPSDFRRFDKLVQYTLQNNLFTRNLDKNICRLSVNEDGACVEFMADCQICTCTDFFCDHC